MTYLDISSDPCGLPMRAGPGVDKTLPQEVITHIFGARETVFAILDGGRVPGLAERLAEQELPALCLFTGDMAEDAGDAAPWLAQVRPDTPLLRQMLCDVPDDSAGVHGLMRRGAGILVSTDADLRTLHAHLRRFLRVTDDTGQPYFFRFWEPDAAAVYFRAVADRADTVQRWMFPREAAPIDAFVIPTWLEGVGLTQVRAGPDCDATAQAAGTFSLEPPEIEAFRALQWRRDKQQLVDRLLATFPDAAEALGKDLAVRVSDAVDRMVGAGFWRRDMLFTFCAWDIHYGADVLERDPKGLVQAAMTQRGSAEDRFALIAARMEVLERDHFAAPALL
ncbi:DUF4123 domain-containing protein [Tateyamaria sp. SN6-1]|uniref:DUF4123 domain-containing protein n=1 Tax=Tateyamaria sp. SN6-1 TaxID=3092148 RepID=UPI0039F5D08C